MPLRTCSMSTRPLVGAPTGSVFFGPRVRCQTNVLAMYDLLPLRARTIRDARHLHPTFASNLLDRRQLAQSIEGGAYHVVRIRGPQALRENVLDARALQHRAHRTAGDYTGAWRRWLHEYPPRAMLAHDLVRNRSSGQRYTDAVPTRSIDRLANGLGHFVRLPGGDADLALPVANGHESVEGESAATRYDLGDTIERDDVLDEIAAFALPARAATTITATTTTVASSATVAAATPAASATRTTGTPRPAAATTTAA